MDSTGGSTGRTGGTGGTGATGAAEPVVDRLELAGMSGVVGRCRDFVSASLTAGGWLDGPGEPALVLLEDVLLMTSELVTNACLHAGGPEELTVLAGADRFRVEVADASLDPPELQPLAPPARPGGHGLRVVQHLAESWGSAPRAAGGKIVWFEIAR